MHGHDNGQDFDCTYFCSSSIQGRNVSRLKETLLSHALRPQNACHGSFLLGQRLKHQRNRWSSHTSICTASKYGFSYVYPQTSAFCWLVTIAEVFPDTKSISKPFKHRRLAFRPDCPKSLIPNAPRTPARTSNGNASFPMLFTHTSTMLIRQQQPAPLSRTFPATLRPPAALPLLRFPTRSFPPQPPQDNLLLPPTNLRLPQQPCKSRRNILYQTPTIRLDQETRTSLIDSPSMNGLYAAKDCNRPLAWVSANQ